MFEEATDGEDRREDQMIINKKEGEEKVKWGETGGQRGDLVEVNVSFTLQASREQGK